MAGRKEINQFRFRDHVRALIVLLVLVLSIIGWFGLSPFKTSGFPISLRSECHINLLQIGIALRQYYDDHNRYPPAYLADESGTPLHSWRTLLLPYLDARSLYDAIRLDEPWNSPANHEIVTKMDQRQYNPFRCRADEDSPPEQTSYLAVIGPRTVWQGTAAISQDDISDDKSTTIVVVEVRNSGIHWMEPRDLHVLQMAPRINSAFGQGPSSAHKGGANVLCAGRDVVSFGERGERDIGQVIFLPDSLPSADLEAMLTINGGETIEESSLLKR